MNAALTPREAKAAVFRVLGNLRLGLEEQRFGDVIEVEMDLPRSEPEDALFRTNLLGFVTDRWPARKYEVLTKYDMATWLSVT